MPSRPRFSLSLSSHSISRSEFDDVDLFPAIINTFQHDVNSVVELPEKGKAVQYGRFNQGGEMPIF
jgi:hypothetical protein